MHTHALAHAHTHTHVEIGIDELECLNLVLCVLLVKAVDLIHGGWNLELHRLC